ncbi:ABC transporter permease [Elusimicrobiota bacterium]
MKTSDSPYLHLLWELTRTEFQLRDQGTVLGFLWTLLHPALMFTVLYFLFTRWMGRFVDNYAPYLLIGIVQYQFFDKTTCYSLASLRRKGNLVRNFKFPKEIIVLSTVGSNLWSYLLEMAILLVFLLFVGFRPTTAWLLLPLAVLNLVIFTLGVSLLLSLIATEYQDLERVWGIVTTAGFYLTPVFYPLSILAENRQALLRLNPMTHHLDSIRACLMPGAEIHPVGPPVILVAGIFMCLAALKAFYLYDSRITDRLLEP